MSDDRPPEVLGALPRTRPHRRSQKRAGSAPNGAGGAVSLKPSGAAARTPPAPPAARAARRRPAQRRADKAARLKQPAQPAGTPAARRGQPEPNRRRAGALDVLGSAAQVGAELAEIALSLTARVLRGTVARLPRP